MTKEYFIKLTQNLYRLTLLFPKKEPLRYKVRGLADEILGNCVLVLGGSPAQSKNLIFETKKDLEILDSYLELAKSQNWVSPFDVLEIQKEYSKIKDEIKKLSDSTPPTPETASSEAEPRKVEGGGSGRQEKILKFLNEKGRAQVWEIQKIFPEVTKRTLRRDFESLLNQDLIERMGERNETFYQIKEDRS
ncbi:DeoR family transcriptional regulator [Candidatus Parcubacteria bacterium]|nr:DeoR family transcriptional regulator [Candidatus Parcubacteria bacterium]